MKNKVILTSKKEVAIVMNNIKPTFLDEIMLRFPHLVQDVFVELDNKSLANCRKVSRAFCDFIDDEKLFWVRKIQNYVCMKKFQQHWKKVLRNVPTQDVKDIFWGVQQILKYNSRRKLQWSPLHIAAAQGHLELCKYIMEKTNDPNPKKKNGITALHMAAYGGCRETCELLIDNLENKNPVTNKGITPFHFASKEGHFDVCELLIQNIDDKNPAALDGCTPLHMAARHGHLEIVRLIVETGVYKSPLFEGETPLDLVSLQSRYRFYKLLSDNNSQMLQLIVRDIAISLILLFMFLAFISMPLFIGAALFCSVSLYKDCPVFLEGIVAPSTLQL